MKKREKMIKEVNINCKEMKKRGMFFSTDAFIAITIILLVALIAYPQLKSSQQESSLPPDILKTLSTLKVKEIASATVQAWIAQGIVDGEKYVIDQIGILAITNQTLAKTMASIVLSDLKTKENLGIWYGNKLIFSINSTSYETANNVNTERYIISGLGGLNGTGIVSGFSARGFLSSDVKTKYIYFGGYIGDGNVTAVVEYDGSIASAEMELAINKNFSLEINGFGAGSHLQSPSDNVPSKYDLNGYLNSFQAGNNTLEITGPRISISG